MKSIIKSLKMLFSRFPYYIAIYIASTILSMVSSLVPVKAVAKIVEMYKEGEDVKNVIIYLLIAFGILFIIETINYVLTIYENKVKRLFTLYYSEDFYDKLKMIDYDFHENPMFLNDYTRSLEEGVDNIYTVANGFLNIVKRLLQSIAVFTTIAIIDPKIILIALGIGVIYLLLYLRIGHINKKAMHERRPHIRSTWYSNRAFTIKDSMADIKMTDVDKMLIENNEYAFDSAVKIIDKYSPKVAALGTICDVFLAILYPAIVLFIALTMDDIQSTLPEFASLTIAASTLSVLITNVASSIGVVENVLPECKVPFNLLEMHGEIENNTGEEEIKEFESLELKNVDFSYKGYRLQLDNINMKINKGEKIAIIGSNGAGKTTLVKLLLHLYNPKNGALYINGHDYKDVELKSLRNTVGAVFQNVETYALTVAENILLRKPETKEDFDLINIALKFSGLYDYVYSLKDNINTQVSREFDRDGVIFSGGQRQKLAIARGYAQNYQLFILDEPSSALDPIAEAKVYENMLELGKDKTLIFISHRLTTTVNADRIYLFESGKIKEQGTHEELLKLGGTYSKMFDSQSKKYIGEDYE